MYIVLGAQVDIQYTAVRMHLRVTLIRYIL